MEPKPHLPPGVEEYLDDVQFKVEVNHGRGEWMDYPAVKKFTNAFIIDEQNGKILLGYKKRNFAKGIYNGFGGKVEPGETALQAAKRELREEACIDAPLEHCGFLFFYQTGHEYAHHIDMYRATSWEGEPTETDEMKPTWFDTPSPDSDPLSLLKALREGEPGEGETTTTAVPFHKMWRDDVLWFQYLITKRRFVGRVDLVDAASSSSQTTENNPYHPLVKWWIATVEE